MASTPAASAGGPPAAASGASGGCCASSASAAPQAPASSSDRSTSPGQSLGGRATAVVCSAAGTEPEPVEQVGVPAAGVTQAAVITPVAGLPPAAAGERLKSVWPLRLS